MNRMPTTNELIAEARELYKRGAYRDFIVIVDSIFGFGPDELGRTEYTKEMADFCLNALGTIEENRHTMADDDNPFYHRDNDDDPSW